MRTYLESAWWLVLLQGILLVLLGFFAVVWPGLTVLTFAYGVAAYFVLAGIINVILSLGAIGKVPTWFLWTLVAALEIAVGVYAFKHVKMTAGTLVLLVGLVFVVRGVQQLISSFADSYENRHRVLTAIAGFLSLVAGVVTWAYPTGSALAFTWVVGVYALIAGSLAIASAVELRPKTLETIVV